MRFASTSLPQTSLVPGLLAALFACGGQPGAANVAPSNPVSTAPAAAEVGPPSSQGASLVFISDDFAAARSLSIQRNVPLFVEAFAPW
jgi:hypothetical protein